MANKNWKVGDRVVFPCSTAWDARGVYHGRIVKLEPGLAMVEDDGWHAVSAVRTVLLVSEAEYNANPNNW